MALSISRLQLQSTKSSEKTVPDYNSNQQRAVKKTVPESVVRDVRLVKWYAIGVEDIVLPYTTDEDDDQ